MIAAIQTSLQLFGNTSAHNTKDRRKAMLTQMNPQLKCLMRDNDFKDAPLLLFGDNFGALAKERLEAAAALKKTLGTVKQPKRDFYKGHSQKFRGRGGWFPLQQQPIQTKGMATQQQQICQAKEMTINSQLCA